MQDMIPETPAQRVFVSVLMLSGALLYGYIIGAVSALLAAANERRHGLYRTITKLNMFLASRQIPQDLCSKLRHYFRYKCVFSTNMDDMHELLESMSPGLRKEVSAHTCKVLITQVPYFTGCSKNFLMECAAHLTEVVFAPMEVAVMRGTTVRHITIIRKGVMVARGRVLTAGRVIGQESLYKEEPAAFSVRSMTFTDANQLLRTTLLSILRSYPSLLRTFCLRSIQGVFREEVLAYTEAVQRIRHGEQYRAHLQHTGDLPAPELDSRRPTDRVHHYMQKLHKYILAEPQLRLKYDTAALTIQSMFKRYKWQQAIRSVRQKLREVHEAQRVFQQGFPLDEKSVDQLLKIKMGHSRVQRAPLPMSDADIRRASVLDFARQVSGTGLANLDTVRGGGNAMRTGGAVQTILTDHISQDKHVGRQSWDRCEMAGSCDGVAAYTVADTTGERNYGQGEERKPPQVPTHDKMDCNTVAFAQKVDTMMAAIISIRQELQVLKGAVLYTQYETATAQVCDPPKKGVERKLYPGRYVGIT